MKDLQDILDAAARCRQEGRSFVLATVIAATGSTYRGPGAHMLITDDGAHVGSISGGCVEHDVLEQAAPVFDTGTPRRITYDTTAEDDILWGMGLGCSGVLHALLQRYPHDGPDVPAFLARCLDALGHGVVATVAHVEGPTEAAMGQHLLLDEHGSVDDNIGDADLRARLRADAQATLTHIRQATKAVEGGVSRTYEWANGRAEVLLEAVVPPRHVICFGAGFDAVPLVRLAAALGWRVTAIDHRPAYADAARLPGVHRVLSVADYPAAFEALPITPRTAAVVMTHNYLHDLDILTHLLPMRPGYLGLLGPTRRTTRLLAELAQAGIDVTDAHTARLFGPSGLDIGAETADEVALSILAEIQAVFTDRTGGSLRDRAAPIHARSR